MERSKAQLELDWQRRCEDAERSGYEKQEELVKTLTKNKEEVRMITIQALKVNLQGMYFRSYLVISIVLIRNLTENKLTLNERFYLV